MISMVYETEGTFKRGLVRSLRERGYFVQPIEAEMMTPGIPDLYIAGPRTQTWCELKLMKRALTTKIKPHWSPGQRSWARAYFLVSRQPVLVAVCLADCFAIYPWRGEEYLNYAEVISTAKTIGGLYLWPTYTRDLAPQDQ
jgi:hypothetical protein